VEAKLSIAEDRGADKMGFSILGSIVKNADAMLKAAKRYRAKDRLCLAAALRAHARVMIKAAAWRGAGASAKEAARHYKKLGNQAARAQALLYWAECDVALGFPAEGRNSAQAALAILDREQDMQGQATALQICDAADRAMGIPTQAELQEQAQREFEYQQQLMLQYQQGQGMQQMPAQMMTMPQNLPPHEEEQLAKSGGGGFKRDGPSPLQVSAGMDPGAIKSKILDLAVQIIGDSEGVDIDMPLMEAGLTSNTAVILRDELSKDLPGINLPPTLMFDYPSIGAIAEFVMEKASAK